MQNLEEIIPALILLWAVIDPIGTVGVFISVTQGMDKSQQRKIAATAAATAAGILLFFIIIGEVLLRAMGVSLPAFQIAGGVVLFLFALSMIFGESKPDEEIRAARTARDIAISPLATPSIASPGAIMAVVLLTENSTHSLIEQAITAALMLSVVAAAYLFMLAAGWVSRIIGTGGARVVSRVMGLILASIAAANVLEGIKNYFA